jgi:two-component system chemotaxis sensor kinase CheA
VSQDPYRYFRVEARELLERLGQGVLDLEKGASPPELVPGLLRLAHTLKGAARVVKQREIAELAHSLEDGLASVRESTAAAERAAIDALLKLLDEIAGRLQLLALPADPEGGATPRPRPDDPARTVRADLAEMEGLLQRIGEVSIQIGSLKTDAARAERARHLADLLVRQLGDPPSGGVLRPAHDELSPTSTKSRSLAEELRGLLAGLERGLNGSLQQVEREMRQVRDAAEQLRLVPANVLYAGLERTVRDAAQALGKRVRFEASGGEVRLDAHVLDGVQGALVQLVRNAVAHGIESEGERETEGKPPVGCVLLQVVRRGNRVTFRCQDDGRGVDLEAIRRVARSKGLIPHPSETDRPEQLLELLLKGGLSTSGEVSEVSGRGIGLDVVREAAARLSGSVSVATEPGRGTRIELSVPVSLSSLEALLLEAAGVTVAIPLSAVRATRRVTAAEMIGSSGRNSLLHDGKVIPFALLSQQIRKSQPPSANGRSWSAAIVDGGRGCAAVGADRLLGTADLVLRPLPALAPADPLVAGVSLDAEGNPQIVLDPEELVAAAQRQQFPVSAKLATPRLPLLVVDDSLTTRMLEQSILESAGYEVDLAVSGEEALSKARNRRYGLFLVDVEMPGMDGFTFIDRARTDPGLREVPAILVTSRNSSEDRRRGEEVGARAYIVKSEFDQTRLVEIIRNLAG